MRLAVVAAAFLCLAAPATADVTNAKLTQSTDRYDHAVLGDALEWGGMQITGAGRTVTVTLPPARVFEDITARVADLDGDGLAEVLVVETDTARGASLAVYDMNGRVTATDFIGQTHRWLAPLGIGDMDGDGLPEVAYVDRPHLARELVVVQYRGGTLTERARATGLTNHRIGDSTIAGGYRSCDGQAAMILANADWSQIIAAAWQGGRITTRTLAPYSKANMARALACQL
jgi:hypothetical protein